MASSPGAYAECVPPPPLAEVTTKVDTEGAVAKVLEIAGITFKADIEVERKMIFTQFPNANQMVVALVAIFGTARSSRRSKPSPINRGLKSSPRIRPPGSWRPLVLKR